MWGFLTIMTLPTSPNKQDDMVLDRSHRHTASEGTNSTYVSPLPENTGLPKDTATRLFKFQTYELGTLTPIFSSFSMDPPASSRDLSSSVHCIARNTKQRKAVAAPAPLIRNGNFIAPETNMLPRTISSTGSCCPAPHAPTPLVALPTLR